jgi:hypothetical protein
MLALPVFVLLKIRNKLKDFVKSTTAAENTRPVSCLVGTGSPTQWRGCLNKEVTLHSVHYRDTDPLKFFFVSIYCMPLFIFIWFI